MIKYNSRCKACIRIKEKPSLAEKLFATTAYDKTSDYTLMDFATEYKFNYERLRNHCKNHQALKADDLNERHMQKIVKRAEKQVLLRKIESTDIWQNVMDLGAKELQEGNIKLKVSDMLRAAKDKADYDLKVKDQELAMIEMVYHFASGANKERGTGKIIDAATATEPIRSPLEAETVPNIDTTEEPTGDSGQGEARPSGVYYPPSWDAATFGTGEVSQRDY